MIELRPFEKSLRNEWDEIVRGHPNGSLFHTSSWLEIHESFHGLKKMCLGIFRAGRLVGVFPLFIKRYGILKVAASPFVVEDTPYMGPVVDSYLFPETIRALNGFAAVNRIHYTRLIAQGYYPPSDEERTAFVEKHTHLLDLTLDETELWRRFEGRCRTAIRKAEKSGIGVRIADERSFVETYYSVLDRLYQRQHTTPPNSKPFYLALWDNFSRDNLIFLTAEFKGECIAGAIMALDKNRMYYLNGASRHEYNHLAPNNLIQWAAIRLARQKGAKSYDFVGSDLDRLAKFKRSFGGVLTPYTCIEKASSPWIDSIRNRYPQIKRIVGRIRRTFDV